MSLLNAKLPEGMEDDDAVTLAGDVLVPQATKI